MRQGVRSILFSGANALEMLNERISSRWDCLLKQILYANRIYLYSITNISSQVQFVTEMSEVSTVRFLLPGFTELHLCWGIRILKMSMVGRFARTL